jgi:pSer/pThr/pTyr-binding forkhead associated (FHA) protein
MAEPFDPYHVWLGIPPEEQPPHYYRLLGIPIFEASPQVIALAAQRQMAHVKGLAIGPYGDVSQRILNELARARVCLMNAAAKTRYDAGLRAGLHGATAPRGGATAGMPPPLPPPAVVPDVDTGKEPAAKTLPPGAGDVAPAGQSASSAAAAPIRSWTIGSGRECDVVIDGPAISRRHCRLVETSRGLFLEDLGSTNGTYLNGRRVVSRVAVCRMDEVRLGQDAIMPWPQTIPASSTRLVRIGRAPDNDIVLEDPVVSTHHAVIRVVAGASLIEDLDSTNGLAIGNPANKVSQAKLSAGDVVYFGSRAVRAMDLLAKIW